MCLDTDDFKRVFSQEARINLTFKVLNAIINVESLQSEGILLDFDSCHSYKDLEILKFNFASMSKVCELLSMEDILIINSYWGSEIAF